MRGPVAAATLASLPALLALLPEWRLAEAYVHSRAEFFANSTNIYEHCYFLDRRYSATHALKFADVPDFRVCQGRCQNTTNCEYFGYWYATQTCWLAGADAVFTDYLATGAIAGPKRCSNPPAACTEVPGTGFPGVTAEESKKAFPSHRVPEKLECWPKNVSGGFYDSCPDIVVLEDMASGWPGLCQGTHQVTVPAGETCESYCRKKVTCSVYQVMNDTAPTCFHSKLYGGSQCYMLGDPEVAFRPPLEAKRMMHGRIRVLKDTTGVQVVGLAQAFDENYFLNVTRDAVPACRNNCYSNIGCQWWQYSRASGCWVEDPRSPVVFPMTKEHYKTDTDFAATVIGGEYIQHLCPGKGGLPAGYGSAVVGAPSAQAPGLPQSGITMGFPTQAPTAQAAAPAETLQGVLTIHGLDEATLTEGQRQAFADDCAAAIASALGVDRTSIRDARGSPGGVTLVEAQGGTQVGFSVDKPEGMTANAVSRALLEHSFIDRVRGSAERLRGSAGEGFPALEDVEVHSVVMEGSARPASPGAAPTTQGPTSVPAPPASLNPLPPEPLMEEEEEGGLSLWFLALVVPAALVIVLGGCAYLYTQSQPREGSGRKSSPGKARRREQDGAPLLGTPNSASQFSSEMDSVMSRSSSPLRPAAPFAEGRGPQGSAYDPTKLRLEGAFDSQAARGPALGEMDGRASLLNAFGGPELQRAGLATSLGQLPPGAAAQAGLQPSVLPVPGLAPAVGLQAPRPTSVQLQAAAPPLQGAPFGLRR